MIVKVLVVANVNAGKVEAWGIDGVQETTVMRDGKPVTTDSPITDEASTKIIGDFLTAMAVKAAATPEIVPGEDGETATRLPSGVLVYRA